jgi:hypothetical protein
MKKDNAQFTHDNSQLEEKLMRLLEMQEHPERYTEEEIRQLMADEECRKLYEQMVRATDALYGELKNEKIEELKNETTEELKEKNHFNLSIFQSFNSFRKLAAVFIGLLILSGITYAAIHYARSAKGNVDSQPQDTTAVASVPQSAVNTSIAAQDSIQLKPVVFEDAELATILREVATFYQYEVVYQNEASKHIRLYFTWNKKDKIEDIVETFNKFERIHITEENRKLIVR